MIKYSDELRDDFCVCLRVKFHSVFADQPFFELHEILYDAVMNDSDLSAAVTVRMRICIGRRSVSRPPRMTDSEMAVQIFTCDHIFQIFNPAFFLSHHHAVFRA